MNIYIDSKDKNKLKEKQIKDICIIAKKYGAEIICVDFERNSDYCSECYAIKKDNEFFILKERLFDKNGKLIRR